MSGRDLWPVLLEGVVGSQAYGLATEDSDEDIMRVSIAPSVEFFGLNPPTGKSATVVSNNPDVVVHEVGKFVSLYLKANPSIVEMLWLDEYAQPLGPWAEELIRHRQKWLSAPAVRNSYLGYARSQFHRLTERGDFGSNTRKRVEKHARHLARLLHQGLGLYLDGILRVELDPYHAMKIREFGKMVGWAQENNDLAAAKELGNDILAVYEDQFDDAALLPPFPDTDSAESFLRGLRRTYLERPVEELG